LTYSVAKLCERLAAVEIGRVDRVPCTAQLVGETEESPGLAQRMVK
jgi:hypothetical protein